jgi:uncharacterized protein (DUF952 family)
MTMALPAIFKIFTGSQWDAFETSGVFAGSPDDLDDGFIHLSTAEQLEGTLARHFAGQSGLVIAEVDSSALGEALRWEESRGGALFPHHYGVLTRAMILNTRIR